MLGNRELPVDRLPAWLGLLLGVAVLVIGLSIWLNGRVILWEDLVGAVAVGAGIGLIGRVIKRRKNK